MSGRTTTANGTTTTDLRAPMREMKVRVPARLATALHARKLITGEDIGSIVLKAVQAYFDETDRFAGALPSDLRLFLHEEPR